MVAVSVWGHLALGVPKKTSNEMLEKLLLKNNVSEFKKSALGSVALHGKATYLDGTEGSSRLFHTGIVGFVIFSHVALFFQWFSNPPIHNLQVSEPMMVSLIVPEAQRPLEQMPVEKPKEIKPKTVQKPKPIKRQVKPITDIPSPIVEEKPMKSVEPQEIEPTAEPAEEVAEASLQDTTSMQSEPIAAPSPVKEEVIDPPKFGVAYLNNPAPDYPRLSRRAGEEGRVLLKVLVTEVGHAKTVEIAQSSLHARLDQAALEAVRQWRFVPARKGSEAVSAYVLVPVVFSLRN